MSVDYSKLRDRAWRLNNLYKIIDKRGREIVFKLNWAQTELLERMWYLNVVLKARQLGISTFYLIFKLDRCLFNSNVRAGVITHNLEDSKVMFRDKIKYAYDALPERLKNKVHARQDRSNELLFSNNSSIRVGTSMRSGTLNMLHVSELGKISARYPAKAEEIKTGAFNTLQAGQNIFVESTAEGRYGLFYDICQVAREHEPRSVQDFRFFFFPWWKEPAYQIDADSMELTEADIKYFDSLLDDFKIILTAEQKAWYVKKKRLLGDKMFQEYPSTPDEAFMHAIEGAYYGRLIQRLRDEFQITKVPYDQTRPVYTGWDLGMSDTTAIWFFQYVGFEKRIIDYYQNSGEGIKHYAKVLREKDYLYGEHFMPHDARNRSLQTGISFWQTAESMGIKPVVLVDRPKNETEVTNGIEAVRNFLSTAWIDKDKCDDGIKSLENYQREWDENLEAWKRKPLHNWASHGADAMRTAVTGWTDASRDGEYGENVVNLDAMRGGGLGGDSGARTANWRVV